MNTALTVPATVETFTLRTRNASGITVGAGNPLTASRIALIADAVAINDLVTANVGDLTIAPNTPGVTTIGLGNGAVGTLNLDAAEAGRLRATGTLFIGNSSSGAVDINGSATPVAFTGIGGLNITSGGLMTVSGTLTTPGNLSLTASDMALTTGTGTSVAAPSGDITVASPGTITLGGGGGGMNLTSAELDLFDPGTAGAAGLLRIGSSSTSSITVTGAIAPSNADTLSLIAQGSISQSAGAGATITETNLRVTSNNSFVNLPENNSVGTLAGGSGFFDSFTFTGAGALAIGTVDGVSGLSGSSATIRSDTLTIPTGISASSTTLAPRVAAAAITLGAPGGAFGITDAELDRISSFNLTFGDSAVRLVTVNSAMTRSSGTLNIVTGAAVNINDVLSAPSGVSVTGASINVGAAGPVSSSSGAVTMVADSMTFNAMLSGSSINLRTASALLLNIGGPDVPVSPGPLTLGLDATDLGNLNSSNISFETGAGGTITVSGALSKAASNLTLTADDMTISAAVNGANVTLNTVNSGRVVDLGSTTTGTVLGLAQAEIDFITTLGTLTINAPSLNVSAPVTFTNAANLTLLADTTAISNTVTQTTGGRITVAPRTDFGALDLGTSGLTNLEIGQFSTSGVLQLGRLGTGAADPRTGSINVTAPITAPAGISALALVSAFGISQTAGNTLTAPNLRIQGSATLTDANNSVGNLAGSVGTLSLTSAGALNVGVVDGQTGLSGSTIILRSDTITVPNTISGSSVTLAPRVATDTISVGTKPGGFGVDTTEMGRISASNLVFGTATHAGAVNVTAPITRTSGSFSLVTGPGGSINVNSPVTDTVGSVSASGPVINVNAPIDGANVGLTGTGANSAVNVNAQVTANNSISVTADNLQIAALLTKVGTPVPSVNLQPTSTRARHKSRHRDGRGNELDGRRARVDQYK